jgi:hypothetical protein
MDNSLEISNISEENKLINFKSQEVSSWTIEHERILIEWADKAMCYRWLHSKANSLYAKQNAWYTIPCIIISTLAGTANFAQERVPEQYQSLFTMVVGGVNILGGIISTIQQFLKITQLNEAHRVSSIAWDKFYRNIKIEITKHPNERIHVSHMLKMCKEEFDRLMETSPVIPDQIVDNFKTSFKNSAEFDKISKPEICDALLSTDTFRNQWFSQENKEKYALDILKIQNTLENKKKMENENNINSVKDFIKTFYNLNHREPIETEIINNLQEKIDPVIIKKILEEIKNDPSYKKISDDNDMLNIV